MSLENRVFKKLFKEEKTELSTQKVELKNIKEIKSSISNLKDVEKRAEKVVGDYEKLITAAIRGWQVMNKERNYIYSLGVSDSPAVLRDFEKNAKELGINSDSLSEVKELKKAIQNSKDIVKVLDSYPKPKE